ncbi:hypothetical protein PVL29_017582 [Vitis rotundifolia]|uniref:Uncharacterized protein n=1 Tax=Vitis rotundifolia TaxID=103349 RepID=A0AA39DKP5_VITRO|nr:hypothetical protein PVL29_017582 [Vitis rotundifolia]
MVTKSSSSTQPLFDNNQSSVFLEFKQSFLIGQHASDEPSAYPKVSAWKCEGEECDKDTGHVIGLNLCSSCLYGSINSSSALFHLVKSQTGHCILYAYMRTGSPVELEKRAYQTTLKTSEILFF